MDPTISYLISVISLQPDGKWKLEKHALSFDANRPDFDSEAATKYFREPKVKRFWESLLPAMESFDICHIEQIDTVAIYDLNED